MTASQIDRWISRKIAIWLDNKHNMIDRCKSGGTIREIKKEKRHGKVKKEKQRQRKKREIKERKREGSREKMDKRGRKSEIGGRAMRNIQRGDRNLDGRKSQEGYKRERQK